MDLVSRRALNEIAVNEASMSASGRTDPATVPIGADGTRRCSNATLTASPQRPTGRPFQPVPPRCETTTSRKRTPRQAAELARTQWNQPRTRTTPATTCRPATASTATVTFAGGTRAEARGSHRAGRVRGSWPPPYRTGWDSPEPQATAQP